MHGDFIGRAEEARGALGILLGIVGADRTADAGENAVVWDVVGMHGIGKSELLTKIRQDAKGLDVLVIEETMPPVALESPAPNDYGPNASAVALRSTFYRSCDIMWRWARILDGKDGDDFTRFRLICDAQVKKVDDFVNAHDVRSKPDAPSGADGDAVRGQLRGFQKTVDDAFVEAWRERTRQPVLLTLDPFDGYADDELGHWLVRMCLRLPDTLTLLARVPGPSERFPDHPRIVHRTLAPFTLAEVREFLANRLQNAPLKERIDEIVLDYTNGHPGGLELTAKLITRLGEQVDATELRRELDRLPVEVEDRWAKLIDLFLATVPNGELVRNAVDAAAVTIAFDEDILGHLLGLGRDDPALREAMGWLNNVGLAHDVKRDGSAGAVPNGVGHGRKLSEFIRHSVVRVLITEKDRRWIDLNRSAQEYYGAQLPGDANEVEAPGYSEWRRYEDPKWQFWKRQWLYHSGQLMDSRSITRAHFCLVFFEAFYWWGCYHEFDFLKSLVEDWDRTARAWIGADPQERKDDQDLAAALRDVLTHYPKGYLKPVTAPWDTIHGRLQKIQDLCGLTQKSDPAEWERMARTNALIRIFLAHSRRYPDPTDPKALRYYRQALFAVEKLKDPWLRSWIVFEIGDLALEAGRLDAALDSVREATTQVLEMVGAEEGEMNPYEMYSSPEKGVWDHELAANLYRAHADLLWRRDEPLAAAVDYGRALEHAYWFQGDPSPADDYTAQFYREMVGRIEARTAEHADRELADQFVATVLHNVLGGDGTASTWDSIAHGPQPDDHDEQERFYTRWLEDFADAPDFTERMRSLLPPDPPADPATGAPSVA